MRNYIRHGRGRRRGRGHARTGGSAAADGGGDRLVDGVQLGVGRDASCVSK